MGRIVRYSYFPILLRRWSGYVFVFLFTLSPFSITLCMKKEEVAEVNLQLKANQFDSRLSIVQYIADGNETYPINKLRNLAIQNVKTDHFWLTDLDMWPSGRNARILLGLDRLYSVLLSLPESVLNDDHIAIIVPAFEIYAKNCFSFANCSRAVDTIFPSTKEKLVYCIRRRLCNRFRQWDGLHDYHFPQWMRTTYTQNLTNVTCFKGNTQEPYVMVKKSESLPPFDERFVNYGYNKVQWLEHLRYRGYVFSILTNGFAVDVPHPLYGYRMDVMHSSKLRKQFMEAREKKNLTLNLDMYNKFRNELAHNEVDKSVVKICIPKQSVATRVQRKH